MHKVRAVKTAVLNNQKGEVPGGVPTRQAMFVFSFQYPARLIDFAASDRLTVSLGVSGPCVDLPFSASSFTPRVGPGSSALATLHYLTSNRNVEAFNPIRTAWWAGGTLNTTHAR